MHIAFPANGRRVAEDFCDRSDCSRIFAFACFFVSNRPALSAIAASTVARPSPKIFRREIFSRDFAEIIVHILEGQRGVLAGIVQVLENLLTGKS